MRAAESTGGVLSALGVAAPRAPERGAADGRAFDGGFRSALAAAVSSAGRGSFSAAADTDGAPGSSARVAR